MEKHGKIGFKMRKFLRIGVAPIDENMRDNSLEMMWSFSKESN